MPRKVIFFAIIFTLWASFAAGQSNTGELRLRVEDPAGLALESSVELECDANQIHRTYRTDAAGRLEAKLLPFGIYRLQVRHQGFALHTSVVEIRSAVPTELDVHMAIAAEHTTVDVNAETLVDPHRPGTINRVDQDTLEHSSVSAPGRSVIDLVNSQPGWLLEANGILHPRGSEYQTQYIVDGVPLTDNRSPAFAPEIGSSDVYSMSILTASYPAEYGRKLGGVIEVSTDRDIHQGLHAKAVASGGSFGAADGSLMAQYGWGKNALGVSADGALTDRYLDPPVIENFTNHASSSGFSTKYERDVTDHDRIELSVRHEQSLFQVPNELVQEAAGQRQDRGSFETMGLFSYQHIFSPNVVGDLRVMSRDDSVNLNSNEASTPILATQQRGLREGYLKASVAVHHGIHEFAAGADLDYGSIHEQFSYNITDPTQFDDGTPPTFNFAGKGLDREQSAYVQDLIRLGRLTVSAGLRFDHYQLVVEKNAVSPRLGVSWYWPGADLVFHGAYDRIFQTPAFENILLASSPAIATLNPQVLRIPVQPSNGNFYEAGLTKGFFKSLKLDVNYYTRLFDNYADDDVLLNTGVSFPISFRKGKIYGAESKLEIPHWGKLSGQLSYSYMVGFGYTPIAGGLFLGNDVAGALANTGRFPVSQDQRNTVNSRFRYQIAPRLWAAFGGSYGSGLPSEFNGTPQDALGQFGNQILDRVNFDRGRVRPSLALNASLGADVIKRDRFTMRLQSDLQNLNNRLNVINFAGLFSGTAIAPPRSYALRAVAEF
ncbi:MAG TPA: TonB-dependent receptor [Candidatus Angelobacter sp.]|nr:TonB-dependent receptor [Candidatus Angelobacter sp.]